MSEIKDLLDKFSQGKITEEEENRLFRLLDEQRDELAFNLHNEYLHLLGKQRNFIKKDRSEQILHKLHLRIHAIERTDQQTNIIPLTPSSEGKIFGVSTNFLRYFAVAASLLLFAVASWLYVGIGPDSQSETAANKQDTNSEIQKVNTGKTVMPIALPDGSSVWLHANSSIAYQTKFDGQQREVRLKGRAFFEVSKNPNQPFVVITEDMITKVLGTSFTVDAFENEQKFSVTVKTGKVFVTTNPGKGEKSSKSNETAISLQANEVAVFDRIQKVFKEGATPSDGSTIKPVQAPENYYFEDVPVADIFKKLSTDYGVPIELDEQALSGCSLNTRLSDRPFFEKLKIICEAIGPGTHFVEQNGVITVSSPGCNK